MILRSVMKHVRGQDQGAGLFIGSSRSLDNPQC